MTKDHSLGKGANLNRPLISETKIFIETYVSCLEERIMDIDIPSKRFNNLTKDERNALYSLSLSKVLPRVRQ